MSKTEAEVNRPAWFHLRGGKMRIIQRIRDQVLFLKASSASLKIERVDEAKDDLWYVIWDITHADGQVHGHVRMSRDELLYAFDISESKSRSYDQEEWHEQIRADVVEAKFIRYWRFLNIPGAGSGKDGDPNISVLLDEDIRAAMRELTKR